MAVTFQTIHVPQQKLYNGIRFPAVISPSPAAPSTLSVLTKTIEAEKSRMEAQLRESGALLFRGFPVNTASDFNNVVEAFGFDEIPYAGVAPRFNIVSRVYSANDAPPDRNIPFHHEMAQIPEYPSKLFFFCEVEPASRGETPILLGHIVYERIKERYPEFVDKLEELGLLYTRFIPKNDDPSTSIIRGWKTLFLTEDKSIAEERAAKIGLKLEWLDDGVKSIRGPIPAFSYDSITQCKIWFNGMVAAYTGWKDAKNDPMKAVTFGDGSPLPADIVYDCSKIYEEESVAIPWRKGDVLLMDNYAVLHARKSFTPPRRVLISLCK